jgi:O-antigen/teichoic acid export membrane protein
MSTMASRDVAVLGSGSTKAATTWRNAEVVLTVFYSGLLLLAIAWGIISSPGGLSVFFMAAIAILFWLMVLQNLGQNVLVSAKSFKTASMIQLFGALFRAGATVMALQHVAATLQVFVVAQFATSMLQLIVTRWACSRVLTEHLSATFRIKYEINGCKELLKRGKPLLFFGMAGAAVMQLDKPIIAAFISTQEVSTYFLAVTFCMTPIAVLAGPVAQYFQPNLISLVSHTEPQELRRLLSRFVFSLLLITVFPSTLLWFYREVWIGLWLGHSDSANQVISYVAVLLPGVVIGALGYIPFAMLTAQQDYHFQARLSVTMTLVTLVLVGYFAFQRNAYAICWVYATYHSISTIASWGRAMLLQQSRIYAKEALMFAIKLLLLITVIAYVVKSALFGFDQIQYQLAVFVLIMFGIGVVLTLIFLKLRSQTVIKQY